MKKVFVLTVVIVCLIIVMGAAGFRTIPHWLNASASNPKKCIGYTIIAFDKGIDCRGDTIRLVRKNGYAEKDTAPAPARALVNGEF